MRIGRCGEIVGEVGGPQRAKRIVDQAGQPFEMQPVTLPRQPHDHAVVDHRGYRGVQFGRIDQREHACGPVDPRMLRAQVLTGDELG